MKICYPPFSAYYYNNRDPPHRVLEEWGRHKGVFVNYWETDVNFIQVRPLPEHPMSAPVTANYLLLSSASNKSLKYPTLDPVETQEPMARKTQRIGRGMDRSGARDHRYVWNASI